MLLNLENLIKIDVYYEWKLIEKDADDNKFADAAIAGGADYIVTNDRHFDTLNKLEFPKLKVINMDEFIILLQSI